MSLTVIGLDGAALPPSAAAATAAADLVLGAPRHLAAVPLPERVERVELGPLDPALDRLAGRDAVLLASGDPGFFGIVRLARASGRSGFPVGDMTGAELWDLLARPFPMLDAMLAAGLRTEEMIYPFGTGRFRTATGVPLISHFVLPMLAADPDELFDALAAFGAAPPVLGFGISKPGHVREALAAGAAGVISGSAIVGLLASAAEPLPDVTAFVRAMKEATFRT